VTYPYDGPYLGISPLSDGELEFRYLDTAIEDRLEDDSLALVIHSPRCVSEPFAGGVRRSGRSGSSLKTMKCFEVTINGEKLCTAGVEDGVLTSILAYVKRARRPEDEREGHTSEKVESLDIRVGGLENISDEATANIDWLVRDLSIGDEIRIRIIDSPVCD